MPEIHTIPVPIVTGSVVSTTSVLATVTGLTQNVIAGRKYIFESALWINADVSGGSKYAINGTAAPYTSSILYHISLLDDTTNAYTITARHSVLGGATGQAGTTVGLCVIKGMINVSVAGTLTTQFAQNVSSVNSSTVFPGSFFNVEMIT